MATCPKGHTSVATDYCDECGSPIGAPQVAPQSGLAGGAGPAAGTPAVAGSGDTCPTCGTTRAGRFCEVCGHDFVLGDPQPEAPATPPPAEATGGPNGVPATPVVEPTEEAGVPPVVPVGDAGALAGGNAAATPAASVAGAAGWRVVAAADKEYYARMQAMSGPDAQQLQFPAFCPERRFTLAQTQVLIGRRRPSRGIEPGIDLTGPPEDAAVSHAHALLMAGTDGTWSVVDLDSANGTYLNDSADAIEPHVPVPVKDGDRIHLGAWTTLTVQREEGH
jgi:hypothetical protein